MEKLEGRRSIKVLHMINGLRYLGQNDCLTKNEFLDFMFRFTDAKYKKEQLADKIDIIKAFRIERKGI